MDADDYAHSNRLEKQIKFIDHDLIFSNVYYVNNNQKIIGKSKIPTNYIFQFNFTNKIPHPSILIKKQSLVEVGGYDGNDVCQDLRTWEKIIKNNYKIHFMNDYLTYIMIDEGRITGSKESRYHASIFYFQKFKKNKIY